MKYDDPTRATDEALAKAFGDIANELAQRGSDAYLLAFKATRDAALDDLLAHLLTSPRFWPASRWLLGGLCSSAALRCLEASFQLSLLEFSPAKRSYVERE